MAEGPLPPLILCMENASGEDVALRIEPEDDFQAFLVKANTLLGFEVDLNSITRNQPVSLTDNIYQFLMNAEKNNPPNETTELNLEILEDNASSDFVYILDDGTQINASQIHFDNDEPPVELSAVSLPFVKYRDVDDENEATGEATETKIYNIVGSPISRRPRNASPKRNFANSLPFKTLSIKAKHFEAQISKYLERAPKILNMPKAVNKSPQVIQSDDQSPKVVSNEEAVPENKISDISSFTREQVLNMFKDSPVTANFTESSTTLNEKRRHVRKTDPSRPVHKKIDNTQTISYIDVDKMYNEQIGRQNCFMCNKHVDNCTEKLYLFDKEDQKMHRSSPQKKPSTQLKIICEECLEINFKSSRLKSPDKSLNSDEYLVIRNNQQYIFQRVTSTPPKAFVDDAKAVIDKVGIEILKNGAQDEDVEFVKFEIGSNGEIIRKSIDNRINDDIVVIKEEIDDNSSDVQVIETANDFDDSVLENFEEADEDVKAFLGKYQEVTSTDLKCRFCNQEFSELTEIINHGTEHKHEAEDGEVYPCPLCDYGYENFKWLKGHLKAAHNSSKNPEMNCVKGDKDKEIDANKPEPIGEDTRTSQLTPPASPIAKRTRSSINKKKDNGQEKENSVKEKTNTTTVENEEPNESTTIETVNGEAKPEILKTEVKQEPIDNSDEEAIWIVQAGDDDSDVNDDQLKEILARVKAQENYHEATMFSIKDTHQCPTCKQLFISEETLRAHKCMKKRGRKRKCDDSDGLYLPNQDDDSKKYRKRRSKEPSSDPQVVTCHNCNESFTSKVRLKFHMQFHEPTTLLTHDNQYQCSECGVNIVFNTETELFDHVHFQHPKQKRWQCSVKDCGKTFYLRATLTKHSRSHTDTRRYVCPSCGKRFLDKQTLDEHGVTHLQIKPYQCHICLKHLTRRSRLRMHLRAHEAELAPALVYVCHVCGRAFKDNIESQEHGTTSKECMEIFSNELKEELDSDNPRFNLSPTTGLMTESDPNYDRAELAFKKATLKRLFEPLDYDKMKSMLEEIVDEARPLIKVVEIEKAFRCEYCEDVFYLEDRLNSHRNIHKGIKNPFTCHICKVTFATYSRCTTHKTTHGFYKRSLADVKKRAESVQNEIKQEMPSAIGILGYGGFPVVKHFLCEDCGRSYLHWTYLQVHRRMKHPDVNLIYKCNQCELTFPNSWSVSYHKKKIHGNTQNGNGGEKKRNEYWIPCRDCEEVLPNKNALYKHRSKEHSDMSLSENNKDEGTFLNCTMCGKRYTARTDLAIHMRTHDPSRPHSCYVCGHSFRTVSMRNEHLRIHTGERPYACDVCGVSFRRSSALRNHRLIHSGVRSFPGQRRYRQRGEQARQTDAEQSYHVEVIEVRGLNPTYEQLLQHLKRSNIPPEKIVGIHKISFPKGKKMRMKPPTTLNELMSLLSSQQDEQSTKWSQDMLSHIAPHKFGNTTNTNESLAQDKCILNEIPDAAPITESSTSYPITLNFTGEDTTDVNVELLLREGVLVNGAQMVQMRENNQAFLENCVDVVDNGVDDTV